MTCTVSPAFAFALGFVFGERPRLAFGLLARFAAGEDFRDDVGVEIVMTDRGSRCKYVHSFPLWQVPCFQ